MASVAENRDEAIGKVLRDSHDWRHQRDLIDAELSRAVIHLRTAATQIEMLIAGERCSTGSPLSHIDMQRLLHLLAEREKVQRKISSAQDELRRLQRVE